MQTPSKPFTTSTGTFTSVPCIRSVKQYTQVGKLAIYGLQKCYIMHRFQKTPKSEVTEFSLKVHTKGFTEEFTKE